MMTGKLWTVITIFLVAVIVVGGIAAWSRYSPNQPVAISIAELPDQAPYDEIYIGGAVVNPGFYPLVPGDSVAALIGAAGGTAASADLTELELLIFLVEEEPEAQKVNINRAELWLLEALPGIGETRAQAIIDYRQHNGSFHNINELTNVEGIGAATYEEIKHLITVAD